MMYKIRNNTKTSVTAFGHWNSDTFGSILHVCLAFTIDN